MTALTINSTYAAGLPFLRRQNSENMINDKERAEWVEKQISCGSVKMWEEHEGWKATVYHLSSDNKGFAAYKKQDLINAVYVYLFPLFDSSSESKKVEAKITKKPISLPPHLQALCDKIDAEKKKFGFTIEEVWCDQLFKN